MKRVALSALVALATTSAIAQTTTDQDKYYVVHNPDSNECTVEEQEPTDPTDTPIIGVFKTPIDAEAGIKTMEVCKPGLEDY